MHCKHTHTLTDARTHVCLLLHMLVHSFIVTVDISVLGFGFLSAKVESLIQQIGWELLGTTLVLLL